MSSVISSETSDWIVNMSHELRTPLTIIRGYADLLENFGAEDAALIEESAKAIKKSSQNMQNLIEKLLFLARADKNNLPIKKVPVEINELLKIIVESYNNPRLELTQSEKFEMIGDTNFLEKMFREFIDNALKYSKGKVFVEVEKSAVKIIDSGIGISARDLEKIFDRFYRADKSRTKGDGEKISFGLGLSIAKWIADKHGMKISIESKIGEGTKISIVKTNFVKTI